MYIECECYDQRPSIYPGDSLQSKVTFSIHIVFAHQANITVGRRRLDLLFPYYLLRFDQWSDFQDPLSFHLPPFAFLSLLD
jgi:hypothetical protein